MERDRYCGEITCAHTQDWHLMTDFTFQYPWALLALPVLAASVYYQYRHSPKTAFSAVDLIDRRFEPHFIKKYGELLLLAFFALFAVLGIANPQYSSFWEETYLESKWIMIVQDLSGSMNRPSAQDKTLTLGDVTLEGATAFIDMRQKDDLIGLTAFSSYAKLISPPTFDKRILKEKLGLLSRKTDSIVFRELTIGGATNASYAAWLALSAFFMMLPQESRLSFDELKDLRHALLGKSLRSIPVPPKLEQIQFGRGMAIVMFTDGRIEANKSDEDVRRGLPNFVNVVKLIRKLGVRFYLIIAGADMDQELKDAIEGTPEAAASGRIFYMPAAFDSARIKAVYQTINDMEKNRLLVKMTQQKRNTRWAFSMLSLCCLMGHCFLSVTPSFERL